MEAANVAIAYDRYDCIHGHVVRYASHLRHSAASCVGFVLLSVVRVDAWLCRVVTGTSDVHKHLHELWR